MAGMPTVGDRARSSDRRVDGDAALVRRIVDAAVTPALLAKEGTTTLLEACDGQAAVIFTAAAARARFTSSPRPAATRETARAMAGAAARSAGGGRRRR